MRKDVSDSGYHGNTVTVATQQYSLQPRSLPLPEPRDTMATLSGVMHCTCVGLYKTRRRRVAYTRARGQCILYIVTSPRARTRLLALSQSTAATGVT